MAANLPANSWLMQVCACVLIAGLLGGCASSSTNTYSESDVGQIISTSEGTVVSSRLVDISGEDSSTGALVGGGAGAITGYAGAGGGSTGALIGVLGALAGAGIGYLVEQGFKSREGIEYIVRLDDGRVVTLVQNRETEEVPLADGSPVLVQFGGNYTRVIERPTKLEGSSGSGRWVNPDMLPPGEAPLGKSDDSGDFFPETRQPSPGPSYQQEPE